MEDQHYRKKINRTEEMFSKENIAVMKNVLHCMFEITLGVKNS